MLRNLNLSSCGIGDAGAEALALALESFPGCIRNLDLSNNQISNDGAAAIGNALSSSADSGVLESLDLSNNPSLGDLGAMALAGAMERAKLRAVSLRSCKVRADGAKAFGSTLAKLSERATLTSVNIDLSGNPLGVLRGKEKKGGKISASALKRKASATTASYMNLIGKKIRSGLKDAGLDFPTGSNPESGDSDDEDKDGTGDSDKSHASKARCGAKAFASAIVVGEHAHDVETTSVDPKLKVHLAMRHCFLDRGGADALAAIVIQSKERLGVDLVIDVRMNLVLEEEMVEALRGEDPPTLEEMCERHMSVLEILLVAEVRAAQAVVAAAERAKEEAAWDEEDDFGLNMDGFGGEKEDSDDYDAEYF